ncbi:hypothetical protein D3C87_954690 [compost metagenome]
MNHLDRPCAQMLRNIFKGVELKRFQMETQAIAYLTQAETLWLRQPKSPMLYSADDWVGEKFDIHAFGPDKVIHSQKAWVVTHYHDEWKLIITTPETRMEDLPQLMRNLRLDETLVPDMIRLNLDLYPPQGRRPKRGWLYDPKNHFWS